MTAWELAEQLLKGPDFPVGIEIRDSEFTASTIKSVNVDQGCIVLLDEESTRYNVQPKYAIDMLMKGE
jgi:hypothetical protein